ncbi:MAG: hypothetical protein ACJAW3_001249 [Lentimonas sp.]|jgi:hypothetical protein
MLVKDLEFNTDLVGVDSQGNEDVRSDILQQVNFFVKRNQKAAGILPIYTEEEIKKVFDAIK